MPEYIEREALIDYLTSPTGFRTNCKDCTDIYGCMDCIVEKAIRNRPAADVAPVQHGRWERIGENHENCTHCGSIFEALPSQYFFEMNNKFCRMCGAKMDGGEPDA